MTPKSLSNTIHLDCLAFVLTMLLTALDVEGKEGGENHIRETSGVVSRAKTTYNNHSICYNSQNQEVKCTKKKGIIVGSVIGVLFLFLGAMYLYGTWSDRRKERKGPDVYQNVPLNEESSDASDCEKGVTKADKDGGEGSDDDHTVPSPPHHDKANQV